MFTKVQAANSITFYTLLSFALWGLMTGCAMFGGGGPTLQRAQGYHVAPPSDWKSEDAHGESDFAYKLPSGHVATLTSSCNRDNTAPLEILTRHLLLGARHVTVQMREHISVDRQEGLHSSVTATFENVPFYLELFVLPKRACIFDFSLVSPSPISEKEAGEFMRFVKSFTYGTN